MKLLDTLELPDKTTHVQIHGVTEKGALQRHLSLEVEGPSGDTQHADFFPVAQVTPDWLLLYVKSGTVLRFVPYFIDKKGEKTRLAPATGGVQINAAPGRKLRKKSGGEGEDATPAASPEERMFRVYMEMADRAERKAQTFYGMQTERDRAFYQMVLSSRPVVTTAAPIQATEDEDDDEEDDDDDEPSWEKEAINALKKGGEAAKPILEKLGTILAEKMTG